MQIAVFLPSWVGDLVMATPALRAIRKRFPEARITGVAKPIVSDVLAGTSFIDEVVLYDHRSPDVNLHGRAVGRQLRDRGTEIAVLMTNSLWSAGVAWLSRARRRVGYSRNGRGVLLTDRLHPPRHGWKRVPYPALDNYLELVAPLGCDISDKRMELATTEDEERAADDVWRRLQLPPADRVVVFNSSGAFGAAKLWPSEYFSALARRVVDEQGLSVLVLCGPSERDIARRIVDIADRPQVVSLADMPLSLGLSKACVRRARLMVTTDSGPRHFACAFDRPVITLFGPTHIIRSETYTPNAIHLQHVLECGPCQKRVCPLGHHRCMWELGVDEVYAAVLRQLNVQRGVRAA